MKKQTKKTNLIIINASETGEVQDQFPDPLTIDYIISKICGIRFLISKAAQCFYWRGKLSTDELIEVWNNKLKPDLDDIIKLNSGSKIINHPHFLMLVLQSVFIALDGKQ